MTFPIQSKPNPNTMAKRLIDEREYGEFLKFKQAQKEKQTPQKRITRKTALTNPTEETKKIVVNQKGPLKPSYETTDVKDYNDRQHKLFNELKDYFSYSTDKAKKLAKILASPTDQTAQVSGTVVGARHMHNDTIYEILETNPTFPYHGEKTVRFQIAQLLSQLLATGNNGYAPDAIFFVPPNFEFSNKTIEELLPYSYHRTTADNNKTKFHITIFDAPFNKIVRNGEIDEQVDKKTLKRYLTLRLRDGKAPNLCYIAENQIWNSSDCECIIDYLVAKRKVPRHLIIQDLDNLKIEYANGIAIEDFEKLLQSHGLGYYFIGPNLTILSKYPSEDHRKINIVCFINNGHCYPIENPVLIDMCKRKEIGEPVFKFDLKKIDFATDNVKIIEEKNLDRLISEFTAKNLMPSVVSFTGSCVTAIHHEKNIYMSNENYTLVKEACEEFGIKFENQTLPKICFQVCESFHQLPTECTYTADSWQRFQSGNVLPITSYFESAITEPIHQIDISRFYTSILFQRVDDWALIDKFCDWIQSAPIEIKPGFYRLTKEIVIGCGYIQIEKFKVIDHSLLKYLVTNGYCELNDICEYVYANRIIKATFFRDMVEHFYTNHGNSKILKQLFNNFIGYLAIQENRQSTGFITTSKDTAEIFAKCYNGNIYEIENEQKIYKVVTQSKKEKKNNYRPLWNQVINESYIKLDQMIIALLKPGRKIYAIKTDCILISGLDEQPEPKPKKATLETIGKYYSEGVLTPTEYNPRLSHGQNIYMHQHRRETHERNEEEIKIMLESKQGFKLEGIAGTGKTWIVNNVIIPRLKELNQTYKILTPTHMAGTNYENYQTLSSYFAHEKTVRYDWLLIDEYSMISRYFFDRLHTLAISHSNANSNANANTNIILIGDLNQALPIEKIPTDYSNSLCLSEITNFNRVTLTRIQRYDEALFTQAQNLLKNGTCDIPIINVLNRSALHICYTNAECDKLNNLLSTDQQIKPMMCLTNSANFSNGQLVAYDSGTKKYLDYNTHKQLEKQPTEEFFKLAYACTAHKIQGQTFTKPIVIHESTKMNKNLFYTAITRVKKLTDVKVFLRQKEEYKDYHFRHEFTDAMKMETGAIYKLYQNGKCIYVGCVQDEKRLKKRFEEHRIDGKIFNETKQETFLYYSTKQLFAKETEEIIKEMEKKAPLVNALKIDTLKGIREQKAKIQKALEFVELKPFHLEEKKLLGYIIESGNNIYFQIQRKNIKKWQVGRRTREDTLKLAIEFQKEYSKPKNLKT